MLSIYLSPTTILLYNSSLSVNVLVLILCSPSVYVSCDELHEMVSSWGETLCSGSNSIHTVLLRMGKSGEVPSTVQNPPFFPLIETLNVQPL